MDARELFAYEAWPSRHPYDWSPAGRGQHPDDNLDFHVDLGAGHLHKARIAVDRWPTPDIHVMADLDAGLHYAVPPEPGRSCVEMRDHLGSYRLYQARYGWMDYVPGQQHLDIGAGLPFADSSIESMVTHHALEHLGDGFIALMDECHRVLKPGAPFRIIVPLFPGSTALGDPDHKRVFQEETFDRLQVVHTDGFAEPWSRCVWEETHRDRTKMPHPSLLWGPEGNREIRVTLRPVKES